VRDLAHARSATHALFSREPLSPTPGDKATLLLLDALRAPLAARLHRAIHEYERASRVFEESNRDREDRGGAQIERVSG
jgi:hypothetical protein